MIPDFAQSLFDRFEREAIPLLLAGGWAVCHHGYSRFTNDIDWICSRNNEFRATEVMKSLGFDEDRKGKDLLDIRSLLAENPDAIPEQRLRELCERFCGPEAYQSIRMTR